MYLIVVESFLHCTGDHGDPDLRMVLHRAQTEGRPLPLVIFGHMHHTLYKQSGFRQMVHIEDNGTVLLNCAVVPRWAVEPTAGGADNAKLHQFTVVETVEGSVRKVTQVWVGVAGTKCWVADSKEILRTESVNNGVLVRSFAVPDQSVVAVTSRRWPESFVWLTAAHQVSKSEYMQTS